MNHERAYHEHFALIESVITSICRRNHLSPADADDFRQEAHLKLLEKGTFEKYEGRSSVRTFLTVVLLRAFKDFRIREWGKWRPSVEAQRRGPIAIRLEQLMLRDGRTFEEALETLWTNHGVTDSREALEGLAARLPVRTRRTRQSDEVLVTVPSRAPAPDALLAREDVAGKLTLALEALLAVTRELDSDERLIVKLRYVDNLKVVQIAALLQVKPKPLYRRIEQLLVRLRRGLDARGVDATGLFDDEEPRA